MGAGLAVTVPAAVFLTTVWAIHLRPHQRRAADGVPFAVAAVGVLLAAWSPAPALVAGVFLGALVTVVTTRR
ncbi:hypothetical protein [Streptomyces longispororuber]|uniref:hypothetical protein n=1 Tax=Streptomyces longispororuber TaxID=68230 RepID=UPI003703374D